MSDHPPSTQSASEFELYSAGQTIFHAGEVEAKMYSVIEGEVELFLGAEVVETVEAGGFFGELSLIEPAPRTTTARAKTDVRLLPIDQQGFKFLIQRTPEFALSVMKMLAARLRDMDSRFHSD